MYEFILGSSSDLILSPSSLITTSLFIQAPEVYTYSDTMISTIPKASTKDQFNLFSTFVSFKRNPPIRTEIGIEACRIELNAATSPPF